MALLVFMGLGRWEANRHSGGLDVQSARWPMVGEQGDRSINSNSCKRSSNKSSSGGETPPPPGKTKPKPPPPGSPQEKSEEKIF